MDIVEWRRKREELLNTVFQLETGRITHWDEDDGGKLGRETTAESLARVKVCLADLDERFAAEFRS